MAFLIGCVDTWYDDVYITLYHHILTIQFLFGNEFLHLTALVMDNTRNEQITKQKWPGNRVREREKDEESREIIEIDCFMHNKNIWLYNDFLIRKRLYRHRGTVWIICSLFVVIVCVFVVHLIVCIISLFFAFHVNVFVQFAFHFTHPFVGITISIYFFLFCPLLLLLYYSLHIKCFSLIKITALGRWKCETWKNLAERKEKKHC